MVCMISFFKRPYQLDTSPKKESRNALGFGLFVFFFLYLFQPFKIDTYTGSLVLFTAGYGLVTTAVMLLLNVVLQPMIPAFFTEQKWTTGREISWTLVNLGCIAAGNVLYSTQAEVMTLSAAGILRILGYTFAIGIFPITAAILLSESRNRNKYTIASRALNQTLSSRHEKNSATPIKRGEADIHIPSENANEGFAVHPESLLFVKAAENYTEVFVLRSGTLQRTVVRATLKMLEQALHKHPQFLRCHKSYIVNLGHCRSLSGNAQGFKLHLFHSEEIIPVSRKLNDRIKDHLETFA